jgi:exodeoxyribonuclease V alpha subunit
VTGPLLEPRDRLDARVAASATGLLAAFNAHEEMLEAADVHVASRLGTLAGETDERVLLALALAVRAARTGSVCVDLSDVAGTAPGLEWPEQRDWARAVSGSRLVASGVLRWDLDLVYLDRYWHQEVAVCEDLRAREDADPPAVDEPRLQAGLARLFPDEKYAEQRTAADRSSRRWTSVITGGPGTGKTSMLSRLLALVINNEPNADNGGGGLRIALAAPTGKAAARLARAVHDATAQADFTDAERDRLLRLEASTLHRLLGTRPDSTTRFRHDRANPLPHDVVVVDETSMVALPMMARLLEAIRPDTRLVLVGDAHQLASVDAGAVLRDLVDGLPRGPSSPVSRLGTTHRFGAHIGALADAVRHGRADEAWQLLEEGSDEVVLVDPEDMTAIHAAVVGPAEALVRASVAGDREGALRGLSAHRLLCAHREGPWGVAQWNERTERWLMDALGRGWLDRWYAGQPLVVNANDYGLRLWNGDTGIVCASGQGLVALVDDGVHAQGRALSLSRLADVSTAHAMTVHRSQGSQFGEVTVVLPDESSRLLSRELFYTAITRAEHRVRVVGTEASVRAACLRQAVRASGLARRLA